MQDRPLRALSVATGSEPSTAHDHPGSIKLDQIDSWHDELEHDPQYTLAKTILVRTNMSVVLRSREAAISDQMRAFFFILSSTPRTLEPPLILCSPSFAVFNVECSPEGTPVANQLASGRCWLFATTNVARIFTARKFRLGEFQLSQVRRLLNLPCVSPARRSLTLARSQSYLFFWDHLAKANYFLEQMLDLADEPLDSRTVQYLLANGPAQDGGQWDLAVALVEEYGLVPQTVYPESFNSSNSAALDGLLTSKLREMALTLRKAVRAHASTGARKKDVITEARVLKDRMLREIFRILTITLGEPPKPDEPVRPSFSSRFLLLVLLLLLLTVSDL